MRVLVLGGTRFLGRAIVAGALDRGHDVTTFTRGRSGPDDPRVRALRGDRTAPADLQELVRGRTWDAVVDTSGDVPSVVGDSARLLAGHAGWYLFVSTVSVYRGWPVEPLTEDAPILPCPPDAGPDVGVDGCCGYPTRYGFRKAGCERAVRSAFAGRCSVLRPGVILGPHEYVGRLPWWLLRISRRGLVVAPGNPGTAIQPVDVRDVAAFALRCIEGQRPEAFNVVAPPGHATFGSMLDDCRTATGSDAELVWMDDGFLVENGVGQWKEIPLWRVRPQAWNVSAARARAAGLVCRPLTRTVRDTWDWLAPLAAGGRSDLTPGLGLHASREADLLRSWLVRRKPHPVPASPGLRPTPSERQRSAASPRVGANGRTARSPLASPPFEDGSPARSGGRL